MFKNLVKKHPHECHEAYFGLAKIYFHLNRLEFSLDCIWKAILMRGVEDHVYFMWQGLILYYLISYGQLNLLT